ncbi:MAG: tetratricopeptide repeat protein [bacterium]
MKKKTPANNSTYKKQGPSNPASHHDQNSGFIGRNKYPLFLIFGIVITVVLYFPALQNSFTNWDDNTYVTNNQYIKSFSIENIRYIFSNPIAVNYHPLTILSLALNYKVSGLAPFSYFFANLLLHILNILLTYVFVLLIFERNKTVAVFAALMFAVHPMHVESVAWISERKDVLYTFFYLAGLISYIIYVDRRKTIYLASAVGLYLIAALSKPSAVVFPLVLLLIDFLRHRKFSWLALLEKLPFIVISVWIGIATVKAQTGIAIAEMTNYTIIQKLFFVSYGFFIYIFKFIFPIGLTAFHSYPVTDKSLLFPWYYFAAPVINLIMLTGVLYSLKYTRLVLFGFLFYFLNIMLTIQFVQVGSAIIAERYTYVSYTGLVIILFWIVNKAESRKWIPIRVTPWFMFLFLIILGSATASRVRVWKNSESLWNDVIEKDSGNEIAFNARGNIYYDNQQYDKAIADFTRSIDIRPKYPDPYFNRGNCYFKTDPAQAINDYSKGLSLKQDYSRGYNCRGDAYSATGKYDSAILDYGRAIRLEPQYYIAYNNRSAVWFKLGNYDRVIEDCNNAVKLFPEYAEAWFNLGSVYARKTNYEKAITCFDKASRFKENNYEAIYNRGLARASLGKKEAALLDLDLAISMKPDYAPIYLNRAILYLMTGDRDKACKDLQTAVKLGNTQAITIYNRECLGKP